MAVAGCLNLFHALSPEKSLHTAQQFRARLEVRLASQPARDITYHAEPFDVACQILRSRRRLQKGMDKSERLLQAKNPLEMALKLGDGAARAQGGGQKENQLSGPAGS